MLALHSRDLVLNPIVPTSSAENPWNQETPFSYSEMWLGTDLCRARINRKITGNEDVHWLDYVWRRYISPAVAKSPDPVRLRCLILGSNEGWMEMKLCENGFPGEIVASDVADKALNRAHSKVKSAGYGNVTHVLADLNVASFEGEFDFIICEGVLHHIVKLERCLQMLRTCMRGDGLLCAVEFEGPFRFQLPEVQVRWINAALRLMPRALRPLTRDDKDQLPATDAENSRIIYSPPSAESIAQFDATEAYSGPELKRLVPCFFECIERTGFGGTLVSYMTAHFDFQRTNGDRFARAWLELLCQIEDTLIATDILEDEFVFYVLRKRS